MKSEALADLAYLADLVACVAISRENEEPVPRAFIEAAVALVIGKEEEVAFLSNRYPSFIETYGIARKLFLAETDRLLKNPSST